MRKNVNFADSLPNDKRKTIRSMCRRLREAEQAEREGYDYIKHKQPASKLWFVFLLMGIGTIWYYRIKDGSPIQSYWSRKRKEARTNRQRLTALRKNGGVMADAGDGPSLTKEEKERARAARLQRFEAAAVADSTGDDGGGAAPKQDVAKKME